jgi:DNA-binding transcriptional LysR family regulator
MLNLYKLEIFMHVAQEGSISAAADQLYMTQSGVSQHIQDLEASLGVRLFARSSRGVRLTPSGTTLYHYAQRILALVSEAEGAVTDVGQLPSGQISIGATPGLSIYMLAEHIQSFRARYPQLTVTMQTKITPEIVADLLARRLELGFIEGELSSEVAAQLGVLPLEAIDQLVVVGRQHPFWERSSLALPELDGQSFIMRQPGSQTRIWLDGCLAAQRVEPLISAEFDSVEAIKRAVTAGSSLTILPEYAIRDEVAYGVLRAIPLEDHPLTRTLKLIWDHRRYFTPLVYSLLAHLESLFPALRPLIVQGRV